MGKEKLYSLVNISGLVFSTTALLLMGIYLFDEISYDTFHKDAKRIVRVAIEAKFGDQEVAIAQTSPGVGEVAAREIPGVTSSIRLFKPRSLNVTIGAEKYAETDFIYADSNFFSFFDFKLLNGNTDRVFSEPHSLVLTEALAIKYFNNKDVLGESIDINGQLFKVAGICEEAPSNSHIKFGAIANLRAFEGANYKSWAANNFFTYLKLTDSENIPAVQTILNALTIRYAAPELKQFTGMDYETFTNAGFRYENRLYPMLDTHLKSRYQEDLEVNSNYKNLYILSSVSLLLLIISIFNYINLSTARSLGRLKEVGVRKTVGSTSRKLSFYFFLEALVFATLSTLLAWILSGFLLPLFNYLSGKGFEQSHLLDIRVLFGLLSFILILSVITSIFPSIYLATTHVLQALKGKITSTGKKGQFRNSLIACQLVISVTLVGFTLTIFEQIQYSKHADVGFDKGQVLILKNASKLKSNRKAFKNQLLYHPSIQHVSFASNLIPEIPSGTVYQDGETERAHVMNFYLADSDQASAMGFKVVSGRYFSTDISSDSAAVVINETALRDLGWNTIEGKYLIDKETKYAVIGVIKDFRFETFRTNVKPMVIHHSELGGLIAIRYETDHTQEMILQVKKEWDVLTDGEPFEYSFLDTNFEKVYQQEKKLSHLLTTFASLAVVVSLLGIFALVAFNSNTRTKEISIRKTLGASTFGLFALLSKSYLKTSLLSLALAAPLAWYLSNQWLHDFADKVSFNFLTFALACLTLVVLIILTLHLQVSRVIHINPANSLRSE
jgi:putative ABC transport system permease protein